MTPKRVYLSAASAEMDRAQSMMGQIVVCPTLTLTHDWTKSFDLPGPRVAEEDLDPRLRRQFVEEDFAGIATADYVWILAPSCIIHDPASEPRRGMLRYQTKGLWVELGFAACLQRFKARPDILVSGTERYQSIFTEVAQRFFATDREALDWLKSR